MTAAHTLDETERQVSTLLQGMSIDFKAMGVCLLYTSDAADDYS
jgi:hypothetical protein